MKKAITCLLTLLILFGMLSGCGGQSPEQNEPKKNSATSADQSGKEPKPTTSDHEKPDDIVRPKLDKDIINSSKISEGMAVVSCEKGNGVFYGIELDGTIVFELNLSADMPYRNLPRFEFVNGLMQIGGGFCDTSGKMTYPKDVGASNFYHAAIEEGYIFADVIDATFDGTVAKMGIMDTSFQWVVEPTEELYQALCRRGEPVFHPELGKDAMSYCWDGYIYSQDLQIFVELETGRIINNEDGPATQPSSSWTHSKKGYYDRNQAIMIDLSSYNNTQYAGQFVNGVAPIVFYNEEGKQHFMTVLDEDGKFLFDPVPFNEQGKGTGNVRAVTDGTIVAVYEAYYAVDGIVRTYDLQGNKIGEFDGSQLSKYSVDVNVEDGIVVFRMNTPQGQYDTWMFTPEFVELLPNIDEA